mmetsp:Transcript_16242/g.35805  ORF Transcript_16242/g.35805 Transcript_16242/m.35805 type:complete len:204 (+) Transcript_16242:1123-1734(+)
MKRCQRSRGTPDRYWGLRAPRSRRPAWMPALIPNSAWIVGPDRGTTVHRTMLCRLEPRGPDRCRGIVKASATRDRREHVAQRLEVCPAVVVCLAVAAEAQCAQFESTWRSATLRRHSPVALWAASECRHWTGQHSTSRRSSTTMRKKAVLPWLMAFSCSTRWKLRRGWSAWRARDITHRLHRLAPSHLHRNAWNPESVVTQRS